ncbi:hypothetical protein Hypma_013487 [Hypsizygus marmoreus]|uniref:HAT C-terminal dimerisation domain-containing protein n=1 Tax=Hypsizygus marmoreus TaxID=39966 RepID=A0A369JFM2_HYPMA|nr:hypothetical protein Hypma_013487 [Hypsizygus marmoreus]
MAITIHYIDAPPDKPNDWELKSELLGFTEIKGNHGGANTAATMLNVFDRYGIRSKLGWATGDNVMVNDKATRCIQRDPEVNRPERPWIARQRHGRCMEHVVHLAAKDFIEAINPTKPKSKRTTRNGTAAIEDDEDEEDDEDWTVDWTMLDELLEGQEIDDPVDFEAGDVVGKILAFINQLRSSPQARTFFAKMCKEEGLTPLQLIKWIRTRWRSMYDLIDCALTVKQAINKFILLADSSPEVPTLNGKRYDDYKMSSDEWDMLELVREVLAEPREAQSCFSSETVPTVGKTLPILECLQERWTTFASLPKFAPVKDAIEKGLKKLRKWYKATDATDMYFICLALDPSIKLEYCKNKWDQRHYDAGRKSLEKTFDMYASRTSSEPIEPAPPPASSPVKRTGYGASWLEAAIRPRVQAEASMRDPREELKEYLAAPLEWGLQDPVKWWGVRACPLITRTSIPLLLAWLGTTSRFRDPLFHPSVHSQVGGLTSTLLRNQLTPQTFEALQILKSGYKHRFVDATEEAAVHEPGAWTAA